MEVEHNPIVCAMHSQQEDKCNTHTKMDDDRKTTKEKYVLRGEVVLLLFILQRYIYKSIYIFIYFFFT